MSTITAKIQIYVSDNQTESLKTTTNAYRKVVKWWVVDDKIQFIYTLEGIYYGYEKTKQRHLLRSHIHF